MPQPQRKAPLPFVSAEIRTARPELTALTGLRALAAWHVLFFHASFVLQGRFPEALSPLRVFFDSGYAAVGLFFVLSGFVLAYRYGGESNLQTKDFYRARFARIYPTYFLIWAVALVRLWRLPWINWFTSVFMLQAWWPTHALAWNPPAWSLSVEAFSYALFPFCLPRLRKLATPSLALVVLAAWAGGLYFSAAFEHHWVPFAHHEPIEMLKFNPALRFPEFLIGVCLGLTFCRQRTRWSSRLAFGVTLSTSLALIAIQASRILPFAYQHNTFLAPLFGLLVLALAQTDHAANKFLSSPPMRAAGNASYAAYLVHLPLLMLLYERAWLPGWAVIAGLFVAANGFGYAIHHLWEIPWRRRLRA